MRTRRSRNLDALVVALVLLAPVLPSCTHVRGERGWAPRRPAAVPQRGHALCFLFQERRARAPAGVPTRMSLRGGAGGAGSKRAGAAPGAADEKPAAKRKRAGGGGGYFMPRPPPPRHGEKPIPHGTPTCLAGMQFVVTGARWACLPVRARRCMLAAAPL